MHFGISLALLLSMCSVANASEPKAFGYSETEINEMTDDEFTSFIAYVTNEVDMTYQQKQNELNKVGVTLSNEKIIPNSRSATTSNNDTTLKINSSHRSGQSYYYLTANVIAKRNLATDAGIEDVISIEWNPTQATYYNTSSGQYCSQRDGSQRNNGIYIFNLYDSNLTASGKYAYCSVMVTPKKMSGIDIDMGTLYYRTYNVTDYTWNAGFSISYDTTKILKGSGSFSLTGSTLRLYTQLYADNVLYL